MMGGLYPMGPRKVEPSLQIRKQKQNLIAYQKKSFFFSILTQDMLVDRLNRVKEELPLFYHNIWQLSISFGMDTSLASS